MNMKLGFVVPIAFLLLQLAASQNATETDDTDDGTDDFSGPPPFGDRPPGPPPGGRWRHGRPPFGRRGPCGPPPPFPVDANGTETQGNSVTKRSIRERRESPSTDMPSEMYGGMIEQGQENVRKVGLPQGGLPRGFVNAKSARQRRELSEMNEEDSANGGGNGGQGNGHQGGPPPQGEGGRGRPRGFVEKRSIRERREVSQAESEGGTDGDTMGQGQGNGRQGGPPPQGGGGRGPPKGFVEKRSIKERRDSLPMNGDDMEEMVGGMMGQGPENGNMNDPSHDGSEGPPRTGRMRRCGGRRGRYRSTTTTPATTTTTTAGSR